MPTLRRASQRGALYFFTVTTHDRRPILATPEAVRCLQLAWRRTQAEKPFRTVAAVVLPDHLHCVWHLPPGDEDIGPRWQSIKGEFTKAVAEQLPEVRSAQILRSAGGGRKARPPIWDRGFREFPVRDRDDLRRHVDYIHFNPVKHGQADRAADWPYSTFRRFVNRGLYKPDWGVSVVPMLVDLPVEVE
jgi:putative transposase